MKKLVNILSIIFAIASGVLALILVFCLITGKDYNFVANLFMVVLSASWLIDMRKQGN